MRRLLAAVLSGAVALQPLAAADATPYLRFQPSGAAATTTSPSGSDATSGAASGITGPSPLYAHVYSLTDAVYALASGKPATFSASGLPSGLSMAADGTLSGTPTTEASGTALVTALSADGSTQVLPVPYEVHGLLAANYPTDADGSVGQAGHVNVPLSVSAPALTGGPVLPVTWATTQGSALPAGVTLGTDGTVSGTPTASGDFVFSVLATDASGATALTQSYDLRIADGIHVAALPDVSGHVGYPLVAETGSATGTIVGTLTWGIVGGPLPSGVTLDASKGTISGTPKAAMATTSAMLSAVDSTGITAYSAPFDVTSYDALGIGTVADMALHVGQTFTSAAFVPENAPVSPYAWRLTAGTTLPSGLGVDGNAGDVYGTGSAVSSSSATVDLVDAQGDAATSNHFAVTVVAPLVLAAIADVSAPSGGSVTVTPSLTGTPVGTLHWALTGHGYGISATQDPTTGAVTFASTLGSTGSYRITASDDSGTYGDAAHATVGQTFAVSFAAPFTASAPSGGTYRIGDAVTLAAATTAANPVASGGGANPSSVIWKVVDGTLPDGLTLATDTGVISGTLLTDAQSATVTIAAFSPNDTDPKRVQVAASPQVVLTVLQPLAYASSTVSAHVGQTLDAAATAPTATGGAALGTITWSLLSGTLPAGMSVDPATGAIVGTPTSTTGDADPDGLARAFGRFASFLSPVTPARADGAGTTTVTVTLQAKDSKGQAATSTATRTVTIVVAPTLSVAAQADVTKRVGDALNLPAPTVSNAVGAKVWSLAKSSAALPSWLSLDPATGALAAQTYSSLAPATFSGTIVRHVVDAAGGGGVDAPAFALTVKPALTVVFPSTVSASFGQSFASATPTVQNSPVGNPTWALSSSAANGSTLAVPSWITADPSTGVVSGTYPGTAADAMGGTYVASNLYLTATDGAGETATTSFSVIVGTNLVLGASPSVYVRQGDTLDVTAPTLSAGTATPTAPYTFSMASGTLPTGTQVTKGTGEISGRPSATDNTASGSLQVVDAAGHFGLGNVFPITVLPPLAVDAQPPALTTYVGGPVVTSAPQVTSNHPVSPITWTLGSGTLPPGAKLASDGTLSGTATQASPSGSPFAFTLNGVDASSNKDPVVGGASVSVTVLSAMTLPTQPAMSFRANTAQSTAVTAASNPLGGVGYAEKGALPAGLSMDGSGNVSGTPTAAGATTVTLTATDSASTVAPTAANQTASQPLTVTVLGPLTLTPASLGTSIVAHVGSTASVTLPSVGNSPVAPGTWSVTSGSLPAPLTLTAGVVTSGTTVLPASAVGDYPLTLTYADAVGATASVSFTLSVRGPLSIDAPSAIPDVTMNVTEAIAPPAVHGNPGSPKWSLLSGALPRGMSVRAADGYLVGTATRSGSFTFVIGFTDASGASLSTGAMTFKVDPLSIPAVAEVDVTMNSGTPVAAPTLNGNPLATVTWTLTAGTLPRGLKANADGTITGSATQSGAFPLTLTATDANGETASVSFPMVVPALSVAQTALTEPLNVGFSLVAPVVVNGARAPLVWTETGALPSGVTSSAGSISGTPTTPGTYPVTLSVKDADGETASTGVFNLVIPTPALTAPDPTTVVLNTATTVAAPTVAPGSGAPSIAWKLTGALPNGTLTFSTSTGAITGKATYPGTFPLTVSATDANGVALTPATFHLVVPAPVVANVADVALQMNTAPVTAAPTVTGDPNVSLTWTLAVGPLPAGLSANADGTLGGAATAPGTFPVQLAFRDPNGVTGTTNVFNVVVPALALASTVADQSLALNASTTIAAPSVSGTPTTTQTWTIASGALPAGLTLAKATGVISGAATRSGTFPVSLKLVDANGQTVTTNVFKVVVAPLAIASAPTVQVARTGLPTPPSALMLHQGDAGYAFPVPAITGTPGGTMTWSATGAGLPPGLAYVASTGTIGGTPTTSGSYTLALVATDANGETATSPTFKMTVLPPLVFGTASNVTLSTAYSRTVAAPSVAGSPQQPYLWQLASGTLPSQVSITSTTGAISGQPNSTGAYPISLSLTDATGDTVTTPSFTLNVNGVLLATAPTAVASVHAAAPAGYVNGTAPTVKFGVPAYSYALASGTPPPGLSVDSATGLLYGTTATQATYPAKYTFAETVTDADGKTSTTATYEVDVTAPLTVTTPASASIHAGVVANAAPTVTNGTGTVSWAVTSPSSPPTGMTVSSTGVVATTSSTPAGSYAVVLTATDATGATASTNTFTVNVYGALALTAPTSKLLLRYGVAYSGTTLGNWTETNPIGTATLTTSSVAGLSFSGTSLTGTPTSTTSAAAQTITATLTDVPAPSAASSVTATEAYDYYGAALAITAADGGTYATNVALSIPAPTVTGSPVNAKFTLSAALPTGLTLNADGSISGTATQATSVAEVMTVTDDTGGTASSAAFTIVTQAATLASATYPTSIVNSSGAAVAVADMYDASTTTTDTMVSGGYFVFTFSSPTTATAALSASTATSGLSFQYNSGGSGSPTWTAVPSTSSATSTMFRIGNATGSDVVLSSLRIGMNGAYPSYLPSLTGNTVTIATGVSSTIALDQTLATANASGIETWALASGSTLPTGLKLNATSGTITGTATATGSYGAYAYVTDARAVPSAPVLLTVVSANPPAINAASLTLANGSTSTSVDLSSVMGATNTASPTWTASGLPTGLKLATSGLLTGTASSVGSTQVTVTVTNSNGLVGSAVLTVTVDTPPSLSAGTVTATLSTAMTATNLSSTMSAANLSGATWAAPSLPSGLSLSTAGVLSGTPQQTGSGSYTVTVTNGDGLSASAALTITVKGNAFASSNYPKEVTNNAAYYKYISTGSVSTSTDDFVATMYDGSTSTSNVYAVTYGSSGAISTDTYGDVKNGYTFNYASAVTTDGSVDASTGTWVVWASESSGWVKVTSSNPQTSTQFLLIPAANIAASGLNRLRLGYGGSYPGTLMSISSATATASTTASNTFTLDTTMSTANSSGSSSETWALTSDSSSMPGGLTLNSAGTITGKATDASGTVTTIKLTVTDSRGIASTPQTLKITNK